MRLNYKQFAGTTLTIILWLAVAYSLYFYHSATTQDILTTESRADDAYAIEWTTEQNTSRSSDNSTYSEPRSESSLRTSFHSTVLQATRTSNPSSLSVKPASIRPASIRPIAKKPVTGKPVAMKHNSTATLKPTPVPGKVTKDSMDEYSDMGGIVIKHSNSSMPINPHPFQYTLNPRKTCDVGPSCELFLLVYVHTSPKNIKQRRLIRSTWGDVRNYAVTVRVVFVMGFPEDDYVQEAIKLESNLYHDIIQEDFLDTYRNLTYKAIGALRWVRDYCSNAKFVLKTDDDAFVSMHNLLDLIIWHHKKGIYGPRSLICNAWYKSYVRRYGKWKVTLAQRKHPTWPCFCQGLAYILTPSVAADLYNASFGVPFLWMDDVYVTGFLAKKIGIVHTPIGKHFFEDEEIKGHQMNNWFWENMLFFHVHTSDLWMLAWKTVIVQRNKPITTTTTGNPCLGSVGCRSTVAVVFKKPAFATINSTKAVIHKNPTLPNKSATKSVLLK